MIAGDARREETDLPEGFRLHRAVLSIEETEALRVEADQVAREAGGACVRRLRYRSTTFAALAMDQRLLRLLPERVMPVRSILFDKTPGENWPVAWHQDVTLALATRIDVPGYGPWSIKDGVVHVQPPVEVLQRMVTLRLHLDPTPAENGALRVLPGSHRHGRLSASEIEAWKTKPAAICAADPGDVLAMRPLLLHASSRSERPGHRRIVHLEYAPRDVLDPRLHWAET